MTEEIQDLPAALDFASLNLSETLLQAIAKCGYTTPTPIQAETIPLLLEGRDVIGKAQTGTGKTAAFALPLLQKIDLNHRQPQVLVLAPTRELAIQVADTFASYGATMPKLAIAAVYGGQDYHVQFRALDRGVHVIVGTPGRVMDHIRRGSLKLDSLKCLVLDEADEMLRMGFAEDVEWVLTQSPAERQMALFSATMPSAVRRIAQQHLRNPAEISIEQRSATADTIHQRFMVVSYHQKEDALARILEAEPIEGALVFVKAKITTEPLAEFLATQGHRTAALSSDVPQKQRERIVDNLRSGKIDIIVATDVAARGLDVDRIGLVVNYDLPFDSESYVHRIGRTGRAGRAGKAILFLHPKERYRLRRIEQQTRQKIEEMQIPSTRVINECRIARFHEQITKALEHKELENFTKIVEQYRTQHEVAPEQIAAALAVLAAGEKPLLLPEEKKSSKAAKAAAKPPRSFEEPASRPVSNQSGDSRRFENRNGEDRPAATRPSDDGMETFRIEVGHSQQVRPGHIVGAITNEIGIASSLIGKIEIFQEHSTVDLLSGMPREVFEVLKRVRVAGRRLNISRQMAGNPDRPEFAPKKFKAKFKKKRKAVAAS